MPSLIVDKKDLDTLDRIATMLDPAWPKKLHTPQTYRAYVQAAFTQYEKDLQAIADESSSEI
jgi:hypothetical protein